jgi:hypothetical protein
LAGSHRRGVGAGGRVLVYGMILVLTIIFMPFGLSGAICR